jgi:hypothetical protein
MAFPQFAELWKFIDLLVRKDFRQANLGFSLREKCAPGALTGRLRKSMAFSMKTPWEPVSSKLAY